MNLDHITPEAMKLPANDRALLAATLWESIEDPFVLSVEQTEEEAIALAIERDREIELGAVQAMSHADLMARVGHPA